MLPTTKYNNSAIVSATCTLYIQRTGALTAYRTSSKGANHHGFIYITQEEEAALFVLLDFRSLFVVFVCCSLRLLLVVESGRRGGIIIRHRHRHRHHLHRHSCVYISHTIPKRDPF